MPSLTASMLHGLTRMAPLRLGEHPTNSLTTIMLGAAAASLHTMYSYGIRFMPSLVAVTTATSAIE
jgi:hypothetical protein